MLREYELTIVANAHIGDEDSNRLFEKYEGIFLGKTGEIIRKDEWGVKRLAYPINKQFRARYVHYDMATRPQDLAEAERLMRLDDNVLRFMAVRLADEVDVQARKIEIAKAEVNEEARQQRFEN